MKELQYINKFFYRYKTQLILGIIITIASKLFTVLVPQYIGTSIDIIEKQLTQNNAISLFKNDLLKEVLFIIGTAIIAGIFTFLMRQTIINVSRYIEFDLKNEIFKHYQNLSQEFYKQNRTGDLMNRITEDVSKVRMYCGPALMYSINTITLFIVALTFMFKQAPMLTLYTILPLPILSVIVYRISREIHNRSTKVQEFLSKLSVFTQESFSGISVIKAYGIEPSTNTKFEALAQEGKEKHLDLAKIQAFFFPMMILLIGISNVIVIYIGGKQYINGLISIGTITEFIIYVNMLTWPVATVGWVTSIIQEAEASQKRINSFLNTKNEIKNTSTIERVIEGKIEFKNVNFTYTDTNITAIKNLSFTVNPGETIAILGKTGSGKSTLLDLVGRLHDVDSGSILIDDTSISELNLKSLRHATGYVPQDAFLFSDTIENNIKFGKDKATEQEVITAAKNAYVHKNIIKFKNGYKTILGERGITLSGGQKQRVSIARAIIKDPKILLFDDCLSAVDTETEEIILNNLYKLSSKKTTLIVSHRVSSAKKADKIIILDKGEIIQQGTHETLINTEGYYKELYLKQLSKKEMQ